MKTLKTINCICVVAILSLGFSSCNKASKVTPIVEKAASEWKAANESDAIRFLKMKNRLQMAEDIYNGYIAPSPCFTCNGYGVVYQIDLNGNVVTDGYGNIQYYFCPTCSGTGRR